MSEAKRRIFFHIIATRKTVTENVIHTQSDLKFISEKSFKSVDVMN